MAEQGLLLTIMLVQNSYLFGARLLGHQVFLFDEFVNCTDDIVRLKVQGDQDLHHLL